MRFSVLALFLLLPACATTHAPDAQLAGGFETRWDILLPVHDYVYLGDHPPACTDARANMVAYRRDRTLEICTGSAHGWTPVILKGPKTCNICRTY